MPELEICHLDLVLEDINSEMQNTEASLNLNHGFFRDTLSFSLPRYGGAGQVVSDGQLNYLSYFSIFKHADRTVGYRVYALVRGLSHSCEKDAALSWGFPKRSDAPQRSAP